MAFLRSVGLVCGVLLVLAATAFAEAKVAVAPIEAVRVEPLPFNALTGATVEPVLSLDSADYSFEYRWFLNGEEVYLEKGPFFPGELLRRGDKLGVEIIPITYSGERHASFSSLPIEVDNAPPVIVATHQLNSHDGFLYKVEAADPDGDPLIYSLEKSPPGMKIDPESGVITWDGYESLQGGVFFALVTVEDSLGGKAEQEIELNLSFINKEK